MELEVKNIEGKGTGRKVNLPANFFGVETPNDHLIYQDVRLIQANGRQGTAKTKTRGEVSGSQKKPFKQKGTGSARQGHKRSPLMRHGGTAFGPEPRDYGFKLNKKSRQLARASALTYKALGNQIQVIENFNLDAPKTQEFMRILNNLELSNSKILLVTAGDNKNVYLSGRNLRKANVIRVGDLNTRDILHAETLVFIEDALKTMEVKTAN